MQNFNTHPSQPVFLKPFLAGGLMFAVVGLLFDFQGVRSFLDPSKAASTQRCETIVQAQAKLSRETLAQLLTIPERDTKARVREVVAEPYCQLPELKVRSGVVAEREAYPLEFDPKTQLVILYENDEYAGYRFDFQ
ncbi:hypothetical protein [Almyronema epifaneia]|uniref:DUF4845 domain-containing protein n=1 Tax=Almyronema epifaneia S1 TaxID=2991925 RepID=A0ABW6IGD5_9CYAN